MKKTACGILMVGLMLAAAWPAPAEEPGRGVARLSLINGDVSIRRGDSGDWIAARVNAPLVVEDAVLTGVNSRAEVQFDWANLVRLAPNTEIRLAELENERYLIQLERGTVTFRILRDSEADVEISTPSVSVRPARKGAYRIEVRDSGESEITVRSGEAEIYTPRGSERLRSGRTLVARGPAADPEYRIVEAAARDGWDRWNEERDRYFERARGYRYAHRSIYGLEDLDYYGVWIYVAPYGWVWSPHVAVGWAPYYYGRWTWVDWYGWTWVSYDPWGWAPYHYGRWFYHGNRWCWWPGGVHVRHYWSPALVAFIGFGNVHVGFGFGRIGWVPLAPYEPYYPWYGPGYYRAYRNATYIDNSVTIVNNINIYNTYRNARVAGGIIAADAAGFSRGAENHIRVTREQIEQVRLVRGPLPVVPQRESLRLSDRQPVTAPAKTGAAERNFFSRRTPAAVEKIPFEEQRRGMEQIARRSFGEAPENRPATAAPAVRAGAVPSSRTEAAAPGQGNVPSVIPGAAGTGGWRRAEEPVRPAPNNENRDAGTWRRFGAATPAAVETPRTAPRTEIAPAPEVAPAPREPRNETVPVPRITPAPRSSERENNGGWRRFESAPQTPSATPRSEPRSTPAWRPERPAASDSPRPAPQAAPERRAEPLRISPPIVRERQPAPRAEAPPPPRGETGGSDNRRGSREGGSGRVTPRGRTR